MLFIISLILFSDYCSPENKDQKNRLKNKKAFAKRLLITLYLQPLKNGEVAQLVRASDS